MADGIMFGPLILFAAVMSLTPGPNVVMVTATAANFGFRRAVPQMLGICLGFGVLLAVSGMGVGALLQADPRLHALLRYGGAAYLLYLAWRIARSHPSGGGAANDRPIGFVEAALLQWVNPKGWVIAVGAMAAYTTAGGDPLWETSVITAINVSMCLLSVALWAGFGTLIGRFLGDPRIRAAFNWSMAGLLVLSLLPVLR